MVVPLDILKYVEINHNSSFSILTAEFPWPKHTDLAKLTDEELGIPPDDLGPCPKIEHPDRETVNERVTFPRVPWRPANQKNRYGD